MRIHADGGRVHNRNDPHVEFHSGKRESLRRSKCHDNRGSTLHTSTLSRITTKTARLLDSTSKLRATEILIDGISSVDPESVRKAVFSNAERSRFHSWGLCTKGSPSSILAVLTSRRHVKLGIIELGLIACDREYRGEGFGSELLRSMIDRWRLEGLTYVTVFADFGAVGFFESIGFTHHIPFPRDLYDCWIDKYSHSALMCMSLLSDSLGIHQAVEVAPTEVQILVQLENSDKHPSETWVTGRVLSESPPCVTVQYTYLLRTYSEVLNLDSVRIKTM